MTSVAVPKAVAGPPLGSRGFPTPGWAPSAGGDAALESEAAYSRQGRPHLWRGTASGVKHLVLRLGSGDEASRRLNVYCKSAVSEAKGDRGARCQ